MLMNGKNEISINMPCAPMLVSEGEAAEFMHPTLVTSLTGHQSYYTRGGLMPSPDKKRVLLEESSSGYPHHSAEVQTSRRWGELCPSHKDGQDRLWVCSISFSDASL